MTDEEIHAYVEQINNTSLEKLNTILPNKNCYQVDLIMNRICEKLNEEINAIMELIADGTDEELNKELNDLVNKQNYCLNYLSQMITPNEFEKDVEHRLVFAKTAAGNIYFLSDLNKVPHEVYGEVKKTLENIIYGVNMADVTKVKFFTSIDLPKKVIEYKGYQVRIFTTKLKDNVVCVIGLEIKKANNDKRIKETLKSRMSKIGAQIDELKKLLNNSLESDKMLADNEAILKDIMSILNQQVKDDDLEIELLFPEEDNMEENIVSNNDKEERIVLENPQLKVDNVHESLIPASSKKVKRRGRGLGKKTIMRREIQDLLNGLSLDDLLKIKDFVLEVKANRELESSISTMYEGFLNMSDDQISQFEQTIKHFKHDSIGKTK